MEAAQRWLHKEKAEALAVGQQEGALEPTESNVMTVSRSTKRTEDIVEELAKQLQKLTDEVSQLRSSPIPPADHQKPQRTDMGACWHCGERGHLRWNCPKRGRSRYSQGRRPASETAAVGSMVTVTGLVAGRQTKMLVDTGSAVTIVKEDVWRETL